MRLGRRSIRAGFVLPVLLGGGWCLGGCQSEDRIVIQLTVDPIDDQILDTGDEVQLTVSLSGGPGDHFLHAYSSDTSVVTVSVSEGLLTLTGVGTGTATVTVSVSAPTGRRLHAAVFRVTVDSELQRAAREREVLAAFYRATGGPDWKTAANWSTDDLESWHGVTVQDGRVTALLLEENNLKGAVAETLGILGRLDHLEAALFASNGLSGQIPDTLAGLEPLRFLDLRDNDLRGPIPEALGRLDSLQGLNLPGNDLDGPIPEALGRLSALSHLSLADNDLSGPIPEALGRLSSLTFLRLDGNDLTGPVPETLGGMSSIGHLSLAENDLSGPIPEALARLSNLSGLFLQDNDLTGEIPEALGNLSNLVFLNLSHCDLSGGVPDTLGTLSRLWTLDLSVNPQLTGPLPPSLTEMSDLKYIDFRGTGLCAPADAAFQEWLEGVPQAHGQVCE